MDINKLREILEDFRTGEITRHDAIDKILKDKNKLLFKFSNFSLYFKLATPILIFIFHLINTAIVSWFLWFLIFKIGLS